MIPLTHFLIISSIIFVIGLYGVLTRRNAVGILMSIELMLNSANLNFVAFSRYMTPNEPVGQIFVVFIITLAAAAAVVGLAIVLGIYRSSKTLFVDKINLMKW